MPVPGISGSGPDFNFDAGVFATAGSAAAAAAEAANSAGKDGAADGGKNEDNAKEQEEHDLIIILHDESMEQVHANMDYQLTFASGEVLTGKTDDQGQIMIPAKMGAQDFEVQHNLPI